METKPFFRNEYSLIGNSSLLCVLEVAVDNALVFVCGGVLFLFCFVAKALRFALPVSGVCVLCVRLSI
jgi:hypothetical protein